MNMIRKVTWTTTLQLFMQHAIKLKAMKITFSNVLIPVVGIVFIVLPSIAFSWSSDTGINTPVSTAVDDQGSPVIAGDGLGGAVIAWTDYRNSDTRDIYAQRVDTTGAVQWTVDGVAVSTAAQHQYDPIIIGDGAGGAIIFWADRRNDPEPYSLYAQRIDASGVAQWTTDGILVAATPRFTPSVTSDGAGGAIVSWSDDSLNVFAQRINAAGEFWAGGDKLISDSGSRVSIASDGSGGAIISWNGSVVGVAGVIAQRLNASGVEQWATGGVAVAAEADISEGNLAVVSDGQGGAVIMLSRYRLEPAISGLHAQKINADGVTQWPSPVWLPGGGDGYTFISDGLGGALSSWWTYSNDGPFPNDRAIYVQGVDAEGNLRWTPDGLLAGYRPYGSSYDIVPIINDGAGGFVASWIISDSNFEWDLYGQHFNVDGLPQWGAEPVAISTSSGTQYKPVIVGDGSGGTIFAWEDSRNGDQDDIYAHKFSADGSSSGLQTPSNISPSDGVQIDTSPTLTASAFVDDSGLLSHAASQWRINNINNITPDTPEDAISADDGNFIYQLPFSFPFFERNITSISANTNGLVELMEDGETSFEADGYGTHWDGDHIGNIDAIFAANDDLDLTSGHLRLYNAGSHVVIEWYGATYADSDSNGNVVGNTMLFQVDLHEDGRIVWSFSQLDFSSHDNDLYSGVYPNGGVEIDMSATSLANLIVPASFEFNPVTRDINPATYNWFVPQPVIYDSGEITDFISHLVPDTAGLEDAVTYYWGVRYMGDNNEWSLWSTPTSFSVDLLAPVVTLTEPSGIDVAINTVIQVTFSEEMDISTINTSSFTLTDPGGSVTGTVNYAATIASFIPVEDLAYNTEYTATITTAVTDTIRTQMASPYSWSFTTGAEADLTPPTAVSYFPARDATDVAIDIGSVSVTFSEAMNGATTVNQNSFTLTGPDGAVTGTLSYDAATFTARFDPDTLLAYSAAYTVTITTDIQDNAGNAMAVEDSWIFSTANEPPPPPQQDSVAPRVVSMSPDGTGLVSSSVGAVAVTFSEPIQQIDNFSFVVSSAGDEVAGTVQYDESAMTAWFYPAADFDFNTSYTVRVYSSMIRDLSGNDMSLDFVGFFTTSGNPVFEGCNPEIGEEGACESFDYFTYGTGAAVNTYGSSISGPTAEYAARRDVSYGQSLTDKENEPPSTAFESQAVARVDSTGFSLRSRSRRMELSDELAGTWSMGASKIDVSGVPPGTLIPMSIVISGNFTGNGGTLLLQLYDFDDYRGLGSVSVVGSGIPSQYIDHPVTYMQMIDPYGDKADAANYLKTETSGSNNLRLDFLYPAVPNNGIYVWFVAGVHSSLASGETDYTATLEISPPPGVTITLASGQVFTGALDSDGDGVADSEEGINWDNAAVASPASVSGTGNIMMDVSGITGATLSQVEVVEDDDLSLVQDGKPADMVFPDGLVSFRLNGLIPGETVDVTLTFPTPFPDNARYYKVNEAGFYEFPYPDVPGAPGAVFDYGSNTVTLTITDGGFGDNDHVANGVIVDPGGIGVVTATDDTVRSSGGGGVFGLLMLFAMLLMSAFNLISKALVTGKGLVI